AKLIKNATPMLLDEALILQLVGHANKWGGNGLALERAESVRAILVNQGVSTSLMAIDADIKGSTLSKVVTFYLQKSSKHKADS
ncbi:MAG: hypothetical protein R8K49_04935, partial [Mariprofundaceae bacterium]